MLHRRGHTLLDCCCNIGILLQIESGIEIRYEVAALALTVLQEMIVSRDRTGFDRRRDVGVLLQVKGRIEQWAGGPVFILPVKQKMRFGVDQACFDSCGDIGVVSQVPAGMEKRRIRQDLHNHERVASTARKVHVLG